MRGRKEKRLRGREVDRQKDTGGGWRRGIGVSGYKGWRGRMQRVREAERWNGRGVEGQRSGLVEGWKGRGVEGQRGER